MKLLTINTHSLQEENYAQKLDQFVESVLKERPDLIAMQEVNQTCDAELADPELLTGQYPIPGCLCKQIAQGVLRKEMKIQIGTFCSDNPAVEHGIDIVRTALEGTHLHSAVYQGLQNGTGYGGLAAAATGSGQHDSGCVHIMPSFRWIGIFRSFANAKSLPFI